MTEGGDDLDCNFIATIGYPEPLKTKDIQKIIDNAPFVEKMLAAGNKKSYMAQMGYLERQGFNDCFTGTCVVNLAKYFSMKELCQHCYHDCYFGSYEGK